MATAAMDESGTSCKELHSNQGLEGSAQQRARCWVPSSLRSSAPPQPRR